MPEETPAEVTSLKLGFEAQLFCGAAGSTPSSEMKNIKDLTLDLSASEIEASTRVHGGWKGYLRGLKDASIEFKSNWDPADEFLQDCLDSFLNGTALAFFISDGDGSGLDADFQVMKFPRQENLDSAQEITITIKPHAGATRTPAWIDGTAGATGDETPST